MDLQIGLQDVIRCHLCETPVPSMHCDICKIHLCKTCVGTHLSDKTKEHKMVPFKMRGTTTMCPKHSSKVCELYCKRCDLPICSLCISSGGHEQHKKVEISRFIAGKKALIQQDLHELEESIFPKYKNAASNIPVRRDFIRKHLKKEATSLKKHGEIWHKIIDIIIQNLQSKIDKMDSKLQAELDELEDELNERIREISQMIHDLTILLNTSDIFNVSEYKSRNGDLRTLPSQVQVTLPTFTPKEMMKREQLSEEFGLLADQVITFEQYPATIPARRFLDEPRILTLIKTNHQDVRGVACLSDSEIWTSGYPDKMMILYNLQGEMLKSVQTKSGNAPRDIAVAQGGELVCTDYNDRTINIMNNSKMVELIRLRGWKPLFLCSTISGDLLVIMESYDNKHTKVVRYSGSTEKESIQWDDQGQPLYSSSGSTKYISENRNRDICVADCSAGAVVVVNADGKLRFKYTGPESATKESFTPHGIATDSQGAILTAAWHNYCIHILDQDGHLHRFIEECGLRTPYGLYVDSKDNVVVADTDKVMKIQYYI